MKPKLLIALALMVVAPLGLLGWLGARAIRYQRQDSERQFDELLRARLADLGQAVDRFVRERERQLRQLTDLQSLDTEAIRERERQCAFITHFFCLDAEGKPVFPPLGGEMTDSERDFLLRTRDLWIDRSLVLATAKEPKDTAALRQRGAQTQPEAAPDDASGWRVWRWGKNTSLLYWRRGESGCVVGAEVDGVRLMSDLITLLPDTAPAGAGDVEGRIVLADADGSTIYQWGAYAPPERRPPRVSLPLNPPLGSWRLQYFAPESLFSSWTRAAMLVNLIGTLTALGAALIGLAVYFYRESAREMREAAQRVTFVNQVSHELKTPLTNIRMYAEMLEEDIDEKDGEARRHVGIIVTESHRLSRLIGNILTFSRQRRGSLLLRREEGVVDIVIRRAIAQFNPSFAAKGIEATFEAGAREAVWFDADALEQILTNLLSNVEKYAADGGRVEVSSRMEDGSLGRRAVVTVSDHGPGIPESERERVFMPFVRLSDALTEGVSGAGIGLSIARDLARLHGGDLRLIPWPSGACFELVLDVGGRQP